jgi:hypothetical protein
MYVRYVPDRHSKKQTKMDDFKKQVKKNYKSSYTYKYNSSYSLKNLSREVLKKTNWAGVGREGRGEGGGGGAGVFNQIFCVTFQYYIVIS